ncbi:LemA family protein [Porphyromonadaceae bacterium W3.11]|nr:LemA family protein [Porphyromonadaceae bacterium W3.11]
MKKGTVITIIIVIVVVLLGARYGISSNNKMVTLEEGVNASWSQVENVYQRRSDLIPNLVNTVKGYAEHEQETLTGVVEARAKATQVNIDPNNLSPEALQQFNQAQGNLTQALGKLMVVVERYPDLKANTNFQELQRQLETTEDQIATTRAFFNDTVQGYNTYIRRFPRNIVASILGFSKKAYFEALPGSETAPEVQF